MHKLKNILISGILSVCIVVTSFPAELLAQEEETVQENNGDDRQEDTQDKVQYELISFAELPESVKNQNASLGTDIEELELPETLTASCRSFKEKAEDEERPKDEEKPEGNTGDKGGEKEPEDNNGNKDDEKDSEESPGDEGGEKDPEDSSRDEDEGITPEAPRG